MFKTIKKYHILLWAHQFQFICGTYPIVRISSSKLLMILHAYRLVENTFGANMATFQRFQFQLKIKSIENQFQFNCRTSSIVQISSLKLSLSPHAYGQVTITNIWCQTGFFWIVLFHLWFKTIGKKQISI